MRDPAIASLVAILSLGAFAAAVAAGAWLASGRVRAAWRARILRAHRRLVLGAAGLGLLHAVAAVASGAATNPAGVGLGVATLSIGVLPAVGWAARRRVSRVTGRRVHHLGYAVVPIGAAHAATIHPGRMAPGEPLLYTVLTVGAALLVLDRVARNARRT